MEALGKPDPPSARYYCLWIFIYSCLQMLKVLGILMETSF